MNTQKKSTNRKWNEEYQKVWFFGDKNPFALFQFGTVSMKHYQVALWSHWSLYIILRQNTVTLLASKLIFSQNEYKTMFSSIKFINFLTNIKRLKIPKQWSCTLSIKYTFKLPNCQEHSQTQHKINDDYHVQKESRKL